jgi:hypothetical protein
LGEKKMEKSEEEKPDGSSEDTQGSPASVRQEDALPDLKKMNLEEMKNYVDDLFRGHIFSEG